MQSGSDRIKQIHKKVEAIKLNEEVGIRFMNAWEEKIIEQQRAREKGLAEGRAEEKNDTAIRLKAMGLTLEQICEATKLTEEEVRQITE
ncbi:MAG: hypothetical protein J6M22_04650 [Firmicutes bacterium]|nr:hypothetical protein [Bacillota bacterium]